MTTAKQKQDAAEEFKQKLQAQPASDTCSMSIALLEAELNKRESSMTEHDYDRAIREIDKLSRIGSRSLLNNALSHRLEVLHRATILRDDLKDYYEAQNFLRFECNIEKEPVLHFQRKVQCENTIKAFEEKYPLK